MKQKSALKQPQHVNDIIQHPIIGSLNGMHALAMSNDGFLLVILAGGSFIHDVVVVVVW